MNFVYNPFNFSNSIKMRNLQVLLVSSMIVFCKGYLVNSLSIGLDDMNSLFSEYKCINMPKNISFCHNGYYQSLRLPNSLQQDRLNEIRTSLEYWAPLIPTNCHPSMNLNNLRCPKFKLLISIFSY